MIVLTPLPRENEPRRVVAVWGAGLIGSSVIDAVQSLAAGAVEEYAMSWSDPAEQQAQIDAIEHRLTRTMESTGAASLALAWCAGRAGFDASSADTAPEFESFSRVLGCAQRLAQCHTRARVSFHMVSSAGGLFEGQRLVTAESLPAPRRPYGQLKWRQEQALAVCDSRLEKSIYRPTSVYGPIGLRRRRGLIATLIANGLCQRITTVFGRMTTLRDFVWVGDVARFIAQSLLSTDTAPAATGVTRTVMLGQGKPSAIGEIVHRIETVMQRRLYVCYSHRDDNRDDITIAPAALPPAWHTSELSAYIRLIQNRLLFEGAAVG